MSFLVTDVMIFSYRPVITIDGTFLYGKYKQKLLIAVAMDGANHIVPLAYALVDEESSDTWSWFLEKLLVHVVRDRTNICLISDRHAGIKKAVEDPHHAVWPRGWPWRWCIRHVASNFNSKAKNKECKEIIKKAAYQFQPRKFRAYFESAKQTSPWTLKYFKDLPGHMWTRAYDGGVRFGIGTTNMAESYNAMLKNARNLPVAALVKKTFYGCNEMWNNRKAEASSKIAEGIMLTDYANRKFQRWNKIASAHQVTLFDFEQQIFEVVTVPRATLHGQKGGNIQMVEMVAGKCSCQKWQSYRIPCSHAMSVMVKKHVECVNHVGQWFFWQNQFHVYGRSFLPVAGKADWTRMDLPIWHPFLRCSERLVGRERNAIRMRWTFERVLDHTRVNTVVGQVTLGEHALTGGR